MKDCATKEEPVQAATAESLASQTRFLIAAVRAFLNPAESDAFTATAQSFRDWNDLALQARSHRISPILWRVLSALPADLVPEDLLRQLRAGYEQNVRRNLGRVAELRRLCGLLEEKGIRVAAFKGPVLALVMYGDLGLRRFADLDLLIPRDCVLRARDLLTGEGYRMSSVMHWPSDSACLRSFNYEFSMTRADVAVDLHWRLLPFRFPIRLDTPALWDEMTTLTIAGSQVPTLAPERQLLFLAAHGAKHCWVCLGWMCDFARFVQTARIDWPRAIKLANSAGNPIILALALVLARDMAGITLPQEAQQWLESCGRREVSSQQMVSVVRDHILRRGANWFGPWATFRFQLKLTDGWASTVRLLLGLTIVPTEAEWRVLPLPPAAYPLYYPYRLGRLAVKHTLGRILR